MEIPTCRQGPTSGSHEYATDTCGSSGTVSVEIKMMIKLKTVLLSAALVALLAGGAFHGWIYLFMRDAGPSRKITISPKESHLTANELKELLGSFAAKDQDKVV
jgi:hypothetical protein